jgi:mannitol 2-dehydrogenase
VIAVPLCEANLGRLPSDVSVPRYDRRGLTPSVVHMSVGSFHRSHQAVYFDELAQRGAPDWGVLGIGLRRPLLRRALSPQDGLYTVAARGADGDEARVVGVMTSYLFAPEQAEAALEALADERTAVVTLTVTAGAYEPEAAASTCAIGYLAEALARRQRAGIAPFTVLSCDNLPGNGAVARRALVSVAAARDERLAAWIDRHVAFPNSMVDRITPQTTLADRAAVARDFGVTDRWPVVTEPFSQWVLEDSFCNRRPPLEQVGVQFVDDVAPYALAKTRLLNATHCAIGFLGSLAGLRRADEAMQDPVFGSYARALMDDEVTPLLPDLPGVDLPAYKRTLISRIANPKIGDELSRLCRNGSSKVASHVVPSIVRARELGTEHRLLTLAVAGWVRYLESRGVRAATGCLGPLASDSRFVRSLEEALTAIDRHGARGAVEGSLRAQEVAA